MDHQRFERTPKGQQEISQGHKTLKGKLRTVLFLIDAGKDVADIRRQIALIGAPVDSLEQLQSGGYVGAIGELNAPVQPTPGATSLDDQVANFRIAKAFMNDTIVDTLGIRGFTFTLRLERCATGADLMTLLPGYAQALLKKLERDTVRTLVERTRELVMAATR